MNIHSNQLSKNNRTVSIITDGRLYNAVRSRDVSLSLGVRLHVIAKLILFYRVGNVITVADVNPRPHSTASVGSWRAYVRSPVAYDD